LAIILVLVGVSAWALTSKPVRRGLDVQGGIRMVLRAEVEKLTPQEQQLWTPERMNQLVDILQKRIDILGVIEPTIYRKGETEIVIELPGFTNEDEARNLLQTTARLEFRYLKDIRTEKNPTGRYEIVLAKDERGEEIVRFRDLRSTEAKEIDENSEEYRQIIQSSPLIVTGDELERAEVTQQAFSPEVLLIFNREGQDKFARASSLYLKEHIAIILDNRIISAPVIQSPNLREPVIQGNFTLREATRLRDILNAGALPVSLSLESINRVEAILGARAWDRIVQAGFIGVGAVMAFMLFYYLLPGFIAVLALGLYVVFALALFRAFEVTMSLPAIAGFLLSTGMAVDANILIFERLKEELRAGKTLLSGIDVAFKRAFPAIFDSNLSTLIICLILYNFGTGPVQGFATTLAIGVLMSFFTAVTCTRTLLYVLVGLGVHPSVKWFGLRRQFGSSVDENMVVQPDRFDFVSKRRLYYAISGVGIVIGLVFWFGLGGLKPGIDFEGGSELVIERVAPEGAEPVPIQASLSEVRRLLETAGFTKVGALFAENNRQLIVHVADSTENDKGKIMDALKPLGDLKEVSFATISPRVRSEIVQRAYTAVLLSLIAILLYIAIRFSIEGGWSGFKFGLAAVAALAHDVLIMVGAAAVLGYFLGWEINALFLTALLTLVGFSINDTIVVYDRIRENLRHRARGETLAKVVNRSLNQTLARSINTSLTLLIVVVALLIWGAVSQDLRFFYVAMLVGVIAGTYSSIFIASQIMVSWQGAQERARERQLSAAKATAVKPTGESAPTPTSASSAPASTATSEAPRKKHRSEHTGKRKRRY